MHVGTAIAAYLASRRHELAAETVATFREDLHHLATFTGLQSPVNTGDQRRTGQDRRDWVHGEQGIRRTAWTSMDRTRRCPHRVEVGASVGLRQVGRCRNLGVQLRTAVAEHRRTGGRNWQTSARLRRPPSVTLHGSSS